MFYSTLKFNQKLRGVKLPVTLQLTWRLHQTEQKKSCARLPQIAQHSPAKRNFKTTLHQAQSIFLSLGDIYYTAISLDVCSWQTVERLSIYCTFYEKTFHDLNVIFPQFKTAGAQVDD